VTQTSTLLKWPARAKVEETDVARRRIWTTACGRYRVIQSHYTLGTSKAGRYADRFYALVLRTTGTGVRVWDRVSIHLKRERAIAACQRHARDAEAT